MREACRVRHFSLRTEEAYWMWTRRFILFHQKRHPREMGAGGRAGAAPRKAPVVLSVAETRRLPAELDETALLMAQLLYGAGLRMIECIRVAR